jgi:cytoskeletal protein CcmA (bactofilin family)
MLEVKRKSNDRGVTTAASRLATARAYKQAEEEETQLPVTANRPVTPQTPPARVTAPILVKTPGNLQEQQSRPPVFLGEAHFKGTLPVDGILAGQLGASNGSLTVRQKSKMTSTAQPELDGVITFRDMLRVIGYIAGKVHSEKGTLIIDESARVDADLEVGVALISGCVRGDIVAHQKVEIGPNAKIYGNIWTKSIEIKNGAIFEGLCKMIE